MKGKGRILGANLSNSKIKLTATRFGVPLNYLCKKKKMEKLSEMEKVQNAFSAMYSFRTYFDCYSNEFNRVKLEKKAEVIEAIIGRGFDFHRLIKEYKEYYKEDGYMHVYDATIPTLIGMNSFIKSGNFIDPYNQRELMNKSDKEVIDALIATVKQKNSFV